MTCAGVFFLMMRLIPAQYRGRLWTRSTTSIQGINTLGRTMLEFFDYERCSSIFYLLSVFLQPRTFLIVGLGWEAS